MRCTKKPRIGKDGAAFLRLCHRVAKPAHWLFTSAVLL